MYDIIIKSVNFVALVDRRRQPHPPQRGGVTARSTTGARRPLRDGSAAPYTTGDRRPQRDGAAPCTTGARHPNSYGGAYLTTSRAFAKEIAR